MLKERPLAVIWHLKILEAVTIA
jgi:hypothetical protein